MHILGSNDTRLLTKFPSEGPKTSVIYEEREVLSPLPIVSSRKVATKPTTSQTRHANINLEVSEYPGEKQGSGWHSMTVR